MQIFFSDPDMRVVLARKEIDNLIEYSRQYSCNYCKNKTQFKPAVDESKKDENRVDFYKEKLICGLTKCTVNTLSKTPGICFLSDADYFFLKASFKN
jgi:transcriptional regulator NrdR family protein